MDLNNHDAYCVDWYRKLIADGTAEDGQRISVLLHDDNEKLESEILALKAENERLKETLAETNHNYDLAVEDNEMLRASIPSCGCQYCLDGIDIIQMKFPNTHECGGTWWKESVRTPKYCPMCGHRLSESPKGEAE